MLLSGEGFTPSVTDQQSSGELSATVLYRTNPAPCVLTPNLKLVFCADLNSARVFVRSVCITSHLVLMPLFFVCGEWICVSFQHKTKGILLKDKPTVYSMGLSVLDCVCVSVSVSVCMCVCVPAVCADLRISMQLQSHVSALKRLNE